LQTAERTSAGFEPMAMIRKGQVRPIGDDMQAQTAFVAGLSTVLPEIAGDYYLARPDPAFLQHNL
jgi:hypothetical protein